MSFRESPPHRFVIEAILIQNFRTLTDIQIGRLGGLNVFVGPNSAGKSSIVEAMGIFFDGLKENSKGTVKGISRYLWHIDRGRENIRIGLLLSLAPFSDETKKKRLGIVQELDSEEEKCRLKGIQFISTDDLASDFDFSSITSVSEEALKLTQDVRLSDVFHPVVAGRGPDVEIQDFRRVSFFSPHMINVFRYIRASRVLYEELKERFARVFPSNKLSIDRSGQEVEIDNLPAIHWGGGHQSVTAILAMLSLGGHIFAIEEPELHLHPGVIVQLSDVLKDAANDSQLFIGTHSQYVLSQPIVDTTWLMGLGRDDSKKLRTFCVPIEDTVLMTEVRNRLEIPPLAGLLHGALIILPKELEDVIDDVELDIGKHARTDPQRLALETMDMNNLQSLSSILHNTAQCRVYVIYQENESPWATECEKIQPIATDNLEHTQRIRWLQIEPEDIDLNRDLPSFSWYFRGKVVRGKTKDS